MAPYNRDRGRWKGHHALYLPALVANRHHPQLKLVYQRLIQRGKPAKVALVALLRYLIIRLNNRLKNL